MRTLFDLAECPITYRRTTVSTDSDGNKVTTVLEMDKHIDEAQAYTGVLQCPHCDFSTVSKAGFGMHIKKHANRQAASQGSLARAMSYLVHQSELDTLVAWQRWYDEEQAKSYTPAPTARLRNDGNVDRRGLNKGAKTRVARPASFKSKLAHYFTTGWEIGSIKGKESARGIHFGQFFVKYKSEKSYLYHELNEDQYGVLWYIIKS